MIMNRLRAFIVLLAIVNPFSVDANVLMMIGVGSAPGSGGGGGGGGGGACTNSTDFSQACNSYFLAIGGMF
jgi:hypothetical protein